MSALALPDRLLLGPGPSPVDPRVLAALGSPVVGHLDPAFLEVMDEVAGRLRRTFQTANPLTLAISGTGSAGMEAAFVNVIEPGDAIIVGVNGLFGQRMVDVAQRCGATVTVMERPWGEVFEPADLERAIEACPNPKLVAVVHAETSTGALQPVPELVELAHQAGALFLLDAVTSLGGIPVELDQWGVDICYSGTQKCLSCPPGLAPLTLSARAEAALDGRTSPVQSWYLDLSMVRNYWGEGRVYHHTAPVSMLYALHAALGAILDEGLEARFERHATAARALWAGLEALGLHLHVPVAHRAPSLTTVRVPDGIDEAAVRRSLLLRHNIEIGGSLGALKGQVWRIGLMGYGATLGNVLRLLAALGAVLNDQGFRCSEPEAVSAAVAASRPVALR